MSKYSTEEALNVSEHADDTLFHTKIRKVDQEMQIVILNKF